MIRIINHHYVIPYKPLYHFEFGKVNDIVDVTSYENRIMPYLLHIVNNLYERPGSRQEVMQVNGKDNNTCLTTLQFQIVKGELILIAYFRSQCEINGRPNDTRMLRYIATVVMEMLRQKSFKIHMNVGNYHVSNELVFNKLLDYVVSNNNANNDIKDAINDKKDANKARNFLKS